jgi:hypothetical protein
MASNFIEAIINQTKALTDGIAGYEIVRILEAAETSIKQKGKEILL